MVDKRNPLAGIDLDALDTEYGGKGKKENFLKGIDLEGLDREYGGAPLPETPEAVSPKAEEFWQGLSSDPTLLGVIKRTGIGALRGAKDVLDTGSHALAKGTSYIADKILPESLAKPIRESAEQTVSEDKAARDKFDKEYSDSLAVDLGRTGGQIAATMPVMPARAMQAIALGAKALPTVNALGQKIAAPLANRLGAAIGQGGLGGATLGLTTSSANDKSVTENVGEGTISGMIGGPLVVGAAQLGKSIGGKIVGKISSTRAELAKRAEELGITLKGSQVSDSPLLKKFDQMSGMFPFSGAQGVTNNQLGQFTRAVSRTFGEDAEEITPKLAADARKKVGKNIENVYKSATVKADAQLASDLRSIVSDASLTHVDSELRPVIKNIQNVVSKINHAGEFDGDTFHSLTKYDGVLYKLQKSSNPNIANSANEIRSALEKALERSLPADQKEALGKFKSQYKAVMTVKDLVEADPEGVVRPLRLMQKVMKSPGGKLRSGELGEIADIGRAFFPTPADSGTPLGEKILTGLGAVVHNPLSAASVAGGALASGSAVADIGAGGVGLILNRLARSAVNSKTTRDAIIRAGTGETEGLANKLAAKIVPYSSELVKKKEPLRITVHPKY